MSHAQANLLLLGCAAVWGLAFLFQKSAMEHLDPAMFVAARSAVAALVLLPLAVLEHRRAKSPCTPVFARLAGFAGLAFVGAALLQQIGIVTASVTNTAFLTALYVVVTPLLAWAMLRQTPSTIVWLAIALSFLGAWLLGGAGATAYGRGEFLVLIGTLLWSVHVIVLVLAAPFHRPILLTAIQFLIAAVVGLAIALANGNLDLVALSRATVEIAFVGVLSSALTFTLFAAALRRTSPAEATIIASSEALFAALGAYLLLGEILPWLGIVGAGMILLAAVVVQLPSLVSSLVRASS